MVPGADANRVRTSSSDAHLYPEKKDLAPVRRLYAGTNVVLLGSIIPGGGVIDGEEFII